MSSPEETFDQIFPVELQVGCDIAQYRGQRANFQRAVRRNGNVVLG